MFEQRTIIDQIEIRRDGTVQLRLDKQLLRDGKVIGSGWHRCAWGPGADFEASVAGVNAQLVSMGEAVAEAGEWDRVRRVIAMEQTPEVVEAFAARRGKSKRLVGEVIHVTFPRFGLDEGLEIVAYG
jgi:hypothetical protein